MKVEWAKFDKAQLRAFILKNRDDFENHQCDDQCAAWQSEIDSMEQYYYTLYKEAT